MNSGWWQSTALVLENPARRLNRFEPKQQVSSRLVVSPLWNVSPNCLISFPFRRRSLSCCSPSVLWLQGRNHDKWTPNYTEKISCHVCQCSWSKNMGVLIDSWSHESVSGSTWWDQLDYSYSWVMLLIWARVIILGYMAVNESNHWHKASTPVR